MPAARLYGRGQEQQRLDLLIGAAGLRRSGSLLLHGDVGTGKTALLDYAVARASGMRVLRCQGEQAESQLPFAALHQLLRPVHELVGELPDGMAAPLAAALCGGIDGDHPDGFTLGSGLLELLTLAARERPLVCVVDDGHWLDRASADALSFVLRRLRGEGIVLLVAVRDGDGRPFEPAGVAVTRLGGLDSDAATQLLCDLAGGDVAPEVARRVIEQTGGIPLALADAVVSLTQAQLSGRAPLPQPLPISRHLRESILCRMRRLPGPMQRVVLLVAAAQPARIEVVAGACAELGIDLTALAGAEAAGMVHVDETAVRLCSNLVHAAVYAEASFFERRAAHLALAHALGVDDDRHAWHLAAAALTRDDRVAADLERAAERSVISGDAASRAEALQRAAQLTTDGPVRARRLTAAARACWEAGRSVLALELLDRTERLRPAPHLGADVAEVRSTIALWDHDLEGARDALLAGADLAAADRPDRSMELLVRASRVAVARSDAAGARHASHRAAALGDAPDDDVALLEGVARVLDGHIGESARVAERAIEMARAAGARGVPKLGLATSLSSGSDLAPGALAAALDMLGAEAGRLRARGAIGALPAVLGSLAWLELWSDLHRPAHANASEGLELARSLGQRWPEANCAMTLAVLAALRGDEDGCAKLGDLLHHPPGVQSAGVNAGAATWAAALADLGACRFAEAQTRLEDLAPGHRLGHPWHALWSRPDAVEAGVRTGQLEHARAALEVLENAARPEWPAPATALLRRSRALLATGREADQHYTEALALHAEAERPFQHARTRLLWAEHLRHNRRRVDARDHLRAALEAFERLDARPWADRARAELRATGETVRRRDASRERLTPQELRIAELVAEGESNREVAEHLFLSPRTVGYHLARVYQKLGISSRTRLARALRESEMERPSETGGQRQTGLSGRARTALRRRFQSASPPDGKVGDVGAA